MGQQLTFKQKNFVREYVRNNGNGTRAALKAYNSNSYDVAADTARHNLEQPKVQEAIEETAAKLGITSSNILSNFNNLASKQPEKPITATDIINANVNLAKMLGMYPDKKNYNMNLSLKGNVKDLPYDEAKKQLHELNSTITTLEAEEAS